MNNAGNPDNVTAAANTYSSSFKFKSRILGRPAANEVLRNAKIVAPLKNLSNFFRFLEMPLINCKIHFEFSWTKNCVMFDIIEVATSKITNTKLYVPIATLSTKDNVNLTKQLNEGFKRPVYWNQYKAKLE